MRIQLIAVGTRMPGWVNDGYRDYADRLPRECNLELTEIPAVKRGKNADIARLTRDEGERMLAAVGKSDRIVLLDGGGRSWSTEDLATQLNGWLADGRDVALLVGGPDGLAPACRTAADQVWSLSKLTFPHPLVRVIVAEQLYRAWTVLQNHPYHRA